MGIDGTELKRMMHVHQVMGRIYADTRFRPACGLRCDVRTLTITMVWVAGTGRGNRGFARVCEILHLNRDSLAYVIREDVPRYEPDGWPDVGRTCVAPMIRRDGLCGQSRCESFRVTNPEDGTWTLHGYCARHQEAARRAECEERSRLRAGVPDPVPNRGGLLPCYMPRRDWPDIYRWALRHPGWVVPAAGIRADDWPALDAVKGAGRPGLTVHAGEGAGEPLRVPPQLRLVISDGVH